MRITHIRPKAKHARETDRFAFHFFTCRLSQSLAGREQTAREDTAPDSLYHGKATTHAPLILPSPHERGEGTRPAECGSSAGAPTGVASPFRTSSSLIKTRIRFFSRDFHDIARPQTERLGGAGAVDGKFEVADGADDGEGLTLRDFLVETFDGAVQFAGHADFGRGFGR